MPSGLLFDDEQLLSAAIMSPSVQLNCDRVEGSCDISSIAAGCAAAVEKLAVNSRFKVEKFAVNYPV